MMKNGYDYNKKNHQCIFPKIRGWCFHTSTLCNLAFIIVAIYLLFMDSSLVEFFDRTCPENIQIPLSQDSKI